MLKRGRGEKEGKIDKTWTKPWKIAGFLGKKGMGMMDKTMENWGKWENWEEHVEKLVSLMEKEGKFGKLEGTCGKLRV